MSDPRYRSAGRPSRPEFLAKGSFLYMRQATINAPRDMLELNH